MNTIFHLAFPCHDFVAAKNFYHEKLGCELGRESEHGLIINLGQNQLVAHRIESALPEQDSIYPRHFGLIFLDKQEYANFISRIENQNLDFYIKPKVRFPGTQLEHQSFFLKDPTNNLIEFKYYSHSQAIFGELGYRQIGER